MGQLIYTDLGRVSAQLVQANQPTFASDDWREASIEQMAQAWTGYFGYFGSFTVDPDAGVVTHHIEAGSFPNVVGTNQTRCFHFVGDDLILDAATPWGRIRNIWRRGTAG